MAKKSETFQIPGLTELTVDEKARANGGRGNGTPVRGTWWPIPTAPTWPGSVAGPAPEDRRFAV
jgi:hypothetical protein